MNIKLIFLKLILASLSITFLGSMNPSDEFKVSQFSYNEDTSSVTLTWTSVEGETYSIDYSTDLQDWTQSLEQNVTADPGSNTTRSYNLQTLNLPSLDKIFVRVRKTNNGGGSGGGGITPPLIDPNGPPNIVFLMTDDQTFYSMGIYGNPDVITPNMDQLGKDGVIFDRHYNTTAICMASRANVFTGLYEYKNGTNFTHGEVMKESIWAKSYPRLLRANGYRTGFAGKFGFSIENGGWGTGEFDVYAGASQQGSYVTADNPALAQYAATYPHSSLAYAAWARDFIQSSAAQTKPFCMSISFKAPHRPTTPDPRFNHIYAGKTFTKPGNYGRTFGAHRPAQSKAGRQYPRFIDWGYDVSYDQVMATYHQQIYGVDVALGMIRQAIADFGLSNNTVIIFTSDNGFLCGSHGFGSKVLPFEESARAPLMIYDPRSPIAGQQLRSASLTGNIDFAPTFLNLAGIPIPPEMDGKSLTPILADPTADTHSQLALMSTFTRGGDSTSLSIVSGSYKYTYWWQAPATEELYDLAADPLEGTNLAADPVYALKLQEMRQKYDNQVADWKQNRIMQGPPAAPNTVNVYETYGNNFTRQ